MRTLRNGLVETYLDDMPVIQIPRLKSPFEKELQAQQRKERNANILVLGLTALSTLMLVAGLLFSPAT